MLLSRIRLGVLYLFIYPEYSSISRTHLFRELIVGVLIVIYYKCSSWSTTSAHLDLLQVLILIYYKSSSWSTTSPHLDLLQVLILIYYKCSSWSTTSAHLDLLQVLILIYYKCSSWSTPSSPTLWVSSFVFCTLSYELIIFHIVLWANVSPLYSGLVNMNSIFWSRFDHS